MKFAFFLGSFPALSLAEIYAVFARAGMSLDALAWSPEVLLAEVAGGSDVVGLVVQLGGIVKVAEITTRTSAMPTEEDVRVLLPRTARKIFFGISAYELERSAFSVPTKKLGLAVKRVLEEEEKSSRFVTSREDALSAVVVNTNKLLSERGAEIVVLSVRGGAYLGRTVWVQPYDEYAERDMGRPERDARVGMLPPKLARMMVNLAITADQRRSSRLPLSQINADNVKGRDDYVLLDPFCGSGTILQEASLMGIQTLIGTDRDGGAIKRTHANLQWLSSMTPAMRSSSFSLTLKLADVKILPDKIGEAVVDAIVTEPYLGPPRAEPLSQEEADRVKREIEGLFRVAFHSFKRSLKPSGRIVMIWPVWRTGRQGHIFLDCARDAAALGFIAVDPLAFPLKPMPGEEEGYLKDRRSLLYQREDQHVMREIRIFDKVEA